MKNRILPLGYKIENGEIVIDDMEAVVVKEIFSEYCNGKSLKSIVDDLNIKNAVFKGSDNHWNKGRVYHILTDRRYIGEKSYPVLLDDIVFDRANEIKLSKSVIVKPVLAEVECLKGKIVCGICGSRYIRVIDSDHKDRWVCANGCRIGCRPTDQKLISAIQTIVTDVLNSPDLLNTARLDIEYRHTPEIMRLVNETARFNEQVLPSFQTGKAMAFRLASSKFSECKEDKSIYTEYVLRQMQSVMKYGGTWVEFLENAVHKISITGKNKYAVTFANGVTVICNGGIDNASKTCNKNRSESTTCKA